jgi:hypothetical protein
LANRSLSASTAEKPPSKTNVIASLEGEPTVGKTVVQPISATGGRWSPEELMVGPAVEFAFSERQHAIEQTWDTAFSNSQVIAEDSIRSSVQPIIANQTESPKVVLHPIPVAKSTEIQSFESDIASSEDRFIGGKRMVPPAASDKTPKQNMATTASMNPIRAAIRLAAPVFRSAYTGSLKPSPRGASAVPAERVAAANDPESGPAPEADPDAALDLLIEKMRAEKSLRLNRVCLCRQVLGFGQVIEFPDATFQPGEDVLIYCEIDNYKSLAEPTASELTHRTRFSGSYVVVDEDGTIVAEREYSAVDDASMSPRRDFYLIFPARVPVLAAGHYRLYLVVHDELGQALVAHAAPLAFRIEAAPPSQQSP